ncbi:hypothetical protein [Aquimarina algiphila]|uniref:hypothetical protein n=1 Tax=Aquimarina algiphila TaxID=2047982 RepID=UPI00232A8220|nr:hypothetical protein [Aquimarina algiphila]
MSRASFIANIPSGTYGVGQQTVNPNDIILLEDFALAPNLDVGFLPQNTFTKYLNKFVYSQAISISGNDLLTGSFPTGYNSGLSHLLNVQDYVQVVFKKTNADVGDPFGGGFHDVESVFGSKNISYATNGLYFAISAADNIIEPTKSYLFLFHFTTQNPPV